MVKSIKVGERTYDMKANAHMLLKYREIFGESCVKKLDEFVKRKPDNMESLEDFLLYGTRLAYIMVCELTGESTSYDSFMKEFDYGNDAEWLMEVIGLAQSVFPRTKPQKQ